MDQPISDEQDEVLASRSAEGDRRAFGVLMQRHGPRLLNIAFRTLHHSDQAQDAVQEAMAAAWFKIGQFDQSRELAPWLTRITLNKCRDHLRRRKVRRFFEFGSSQEHELETADDREFTAREINCGMQRKTLRDRPSGRVMMLNTALYSGQNLCFPSTAEN